MRIPDFDEPEPDLAVARGQPDDYATRHPGPDDIALLIEVADASLRRDRGEKLGSYGRGGIPHYWIINLVDRVVECYSKPNRGGIGYGSRQIFGPGESVPVVLLDGEVGQIAVADLLP